MSNKIQLCAVKQYVKIDKLKVHPNNPRSITDERLQELKRSIINKGFYEPILVWKKGAVILSGNHRYMAAQQLLKEGWDFEGPNGEKDVLPVVIEDMPYKQAEAILFEANNHYANWVDEKLKKAIQEAVEHGSDAKDFGFDDKALKRMLDSAIEDVEAISDKKKQRKLDAELKREIKTVDGEELYEEEKLPEVDSEAINATYTKLDDAEEYGFLTLPKRQIEQLQECFAQIGHENNISELTAIVDLVIKRLSK